MIKRILIAIIFVLMCASISLASPFLACDIPTDPVERSDVKIDGVTVEGVAEIMPDGVSMKLLDLAGFAPGYHTFEARFIHASGWPGGWSSPLNAGKPAIPGTVMIVE